MPRFINDDVKLKSGGRKAPKITIDELKEKLVIFYNKNFSDDPIKTFDELCIFSIMETDRILEDMKFDMYWENIDLIGTEKFSHGIGNTLIGFHTLPNGFTFMGVCGCADWGLSSFIIFYYDGKTIRSYTPSYGNLINLDFKCAIGLEGEYSTVDESKIEEKYRRLGFYKEANTSSVNEPAKAIFTNTLAGWDEMYLKKYELTESTACFNWNAIKEDIMSRITLI